MNIDVIVTPHAKTSHMEYLKTGIKVPSSFNPDSTGGYSITGRFISIDKFNNAQKNGFIVFFTYEGKSRACLVFVHHAKKQKSHIVKSENFIESGEIGFSFCGFNIVVKVDLGEKYKYFLTTDEKSNLIFNIETNTLREIVKSSSFNSSHTLHKCFNSFYGAGLLLWHYNCLALSNSNASTQPFPIIPSNSISQDGSLSMDAYDHAQFFKEPNKSKYPYLPNLPNRFWYSNDVSGIIFMSFKKQKEKNAKTPMLFLSVIGEYLNEIGDEDKEAWVNFLESQSSKLMGMSYLYSTLAEVIKNHVLTKEEKQDTIKQK